MTDAVPVPRARDFMNRQVQTVRADQSLEDVTNFLITHELSNAPVVEPCDEGPPVLLGFLSEGDCLEHLSNELFHGRTQQARTARTIMKGHPICVAPDTELFTLASILVSHGFRHLPVVENDRLLGIVSRRDILRAIDAYYREWVLKDQQEHFPPELTAFQKLRFQLTGKRS